jgi:RNA polymerase sigma-32 factor
LSKWVPTNQKRLFFCLSKAKQRLLSHREADFRGDEASLIASWLGVTAHEVVEMNRLLSGDISLNTPMNEYDNSLELQDRLVDEGPDQESRLAQSDELEMRRRALGLALTSSERVRQIEERAFKKVRSAVHLATARKTRMPNYPLQVDERGAKCRPG